MRRAAVAALGLLVFAAPALAAGGNMSVAAFLAKADALKAKGAMALFSPDIKLLRAEGQAAGEAYKLRLQAERKAGNPSSCPPKGTRPGQGEVMTHLRSYPTEHRGHITMKTAIADYFVKRYPCR